MAVEFDDGCNTIMALFADREELEKWRNCLTRFEANAHLGLMEDSAELISNVAQFGKNLVVLVSQRLFSQDKTLADELRSKLPLAHLVVLVSPREGYSQFQDLLQKRITHVVVDPCCTGLGSLETAPMLQVTIDNLLNQRCWKIDDYLKEGTAIVNYAVSSSGQKEDLIESIAALIDGDTPQHELLRQRSALLADELFENAFYGAPRTSEGTPLFPKGIERTLTLPEAVVFSFGFDGSTFAMEASDSWGSLTTETVLDHMAANETDPLETFSGRGLFIVWRFFDHFHICILPGKLTSVGGKLDLASELSDTPKGFNITDAAVEKDMHHGK